MAYKSITARVAVANNVPNPTNLALALPTRANGDTLLAISSCRSRTAVPTCTAGWTPLPGFPRASATTSGGQIAVFYCKVDGSEPTPTVTWTGVATGTTGDASQGVVVCLDNDFTLDVAITATDANGAHPSIPTLTTLTADTTVVGISMKVSDTAQTGTIANSFTERGDFHTTSGTGHHLYIATRQMATPGATGPSTVTQTSAVAAEYLTVAIALRKRLPVTYFGATDGRFIFWGVTTAGQASTPVPFEDPASVPGLTNWYAVDSFPPYSDGTPVTVWFDSSPGFRDLSGNATYRTNQLNGKPGVEFNGTTDYLSHLAAVAFHQGKGATVFAVVRRIAGTSNGRMLAFNATDDVDYTTPSWCIYEGGSNDRVAPYSNGELAIQVPHPTGALLMTTWFDGTNHNLRIDGAPASTPQFSTAQMEPYTFATKRITLASGWMNGATSGGNYMIYEVVVYHRALTGAERADVEAYLTDKWLEAPPPPTTHYGASSLAASFGAVTAGVASKPAVTHYGSVSVAASFGAATAGRRRTFAQVARSATFAATTAAQRRTFGQVARPTTFGVAAVGGRRTFGIVARPSTVGVAVQARRTTFSGTVAPLLFGAATAGVKAAAMKYGAVALPVSFGSATSAQRRTTGAVALPVALGAVTAGRRRTTSAIVLPSTFGAVVAGRRRTFSSTVTPVLLTATTAGQRIASGLYGAASLTVAFGATTSARRRTFGLVARPATFGAVVQARRTTRSSVVAPLSFGAATFGQRRAFGAVLLPVSFSATTAGRKIGLTGIVALPMTLTAATQGRRRTFGQVALPVTLGEVTQARRRTFGQVARPVTFGEVTAGQRRAFGRVALALALTEVTAGQRRTFGRVALPILLTEVTAARRQALGRVALALVLQPAVIGQRRTFGVVALPLTLDLFSHSRDQGVVLNRADAVYLSGQAANEVSVGAVEVWT